MNLEGSRIWRKERGGSDIGAIVMYEVLDFSVPKVIFFWIFNAFVSVSVHLSMINKYEIPFSNVQIGKVSN